MAMLLLLLCGMDRLPVECRRVDVIELSHVYAVDLQGGRQVVRETVVQWIFWVWSPARGRYCVVEWRMANGPAALSGRVLVLSARGRLYRIEATALRETWGTEDPELQAREQEALDWERPGLGW